jgi:hypothetical protein
MRLLISLLLMLLFASWTIAADTIVMLGAAVPFAGADAELKAHVEALGFEVEEHSQDEAQPVDISGAAGVLIGEALGSSNITDAYKDAPIPVIITEAYVLDDMRFATDGTFNAAQDMALTIVDPAHPIAGGLSGNVDIASAAIDICSTSDIQGDVHVVANVLANGHTAIACYEEGANDMDGAPVPARRVFVFIHELITPLLNDAGWGLVERSVLWAMGALSETAVTPEAAVATTWGDLKADYR